MFAISKMDNKEEPRFLLDCVPRNLVTIKDKTPLSTVNEIIDFIASRPFRSKLDLTDCYHNIRIEPESVQHFTFLALLGYYNSQIMQQGDCNAPATMMKVMNNMFRDKLGRTIMIYLDNILIATETYEEHVKVLREIFNKLGNEQFWLNKKKTSILPTKLGILRHILSDKGLEANPAHINKVLAFPIPKNQTQLQQSTGVINWLSKFCPHLATIAAPLTDLQGTKAWKWGPTQQESFKKCQELIASNAVIKPLNPNSKDSI